MSNNTTIGLDNLKALFYAFPKWEDYIFFRKRLYKFFNYFFLKYYNSQDLEAFLDTKEYCKFSNSDKIKSLLDEISKYTNILYFIKSFFVFYNPRDVIDYYYSYLYEHNKERDKIEVLLKKIDELGFDTVTLVSQEDMSLLQEKILLSCRMPNQFFFMENIQAIPNYEGIFHYTSYNTNYIFRIDRGMDAYGRYGSRWYKNSLMVSNLIFDPERLPDEISEEDIITKIKSLNNEEYVKECKLLRNSLALDISAVELMSIYHDLEKELHEISNKKDLKKILENINKSIGSLKEYSDKYTESIIGDTITRELISEEEKDYYLEKKRKQIKLKGFGYGNRN